MPEPDTRPATTTTTATTTASPPRHDPHHDKEATMKVPHRHRHRIRPLAAIALTLGLVLSACSSGDSVSVDDTEGSDTTEAATDGATDAGTEAAGGGAGGMLVAAQGSDPDRLDPHLTSAYASFQILENVYDTLVQPADDLSMEPALAESWEVSDDGLTWTFTLREGVTFHDGSSFEAADVVYSYDRIMDPDVGANNAYRFGSVESVEAVDDTTVAITLTRPTPNLLVNIGGFKGMAIIPEGYAEDGDIDNEPVGTGPFSFVSSAPDTGIELAANPDWWGGAPALEGIRFVQIPDANAKLTALQTGEVDWIDSVPPQSLETLSGEEGITVEQVAGGDYHYFALNQERAPFDDERVRRAIAMAIDRDVIAEAAQFGAATANQTAIPPSNEAWYHEYAPFAPADVAGAQALLDEAGNPDLAIEFLVTSDYPETVTQAQVLESQLGEIGVDVTIADVDFGTWLDRQGQGDFDAFMLSWVGNIDPDDFYYAQHHSEGGFNFQGNSNADLDALLDEARVETDEAARKALYDQAAELIVDSASYTYLYNPDNTGAWSSDVSGYQVRGDNAVRFAGASLG